MKLANLNDLKNIYLDIPALTAITSIIIPHQLQQNIKKNQADALLYLKYKKILFASLGLSQVQPLDQAPHVQDHEADRQYQH